ncbi:MAG: AbrB/MazE/SpoVT family DNA-binding domain-containing protein [Acidimicrobiales bacterium]
MGDHPGAKGQVVIPKELRDLGIEPGDEVNFWLQR